MSARQLGLLVAGGVVTTAWPLLCQRLTVFESNGLRSLTECWSVLWVAIAAAKVVRWWLRSRQQVGYPALGAPAIASSDDDITDLKKASAAGGSAAAAAAAAAAAGVPPSSALGAGEGEVPDADDVTQQKRRAQAEQAAAEQLSRQAVASAAQLLREALGRGSGGGDLAGAALAARALADALMGSPHPLGELLANGGLLEISALIDRSAAAAEDAAALPAMLQASWVLMQVAHGPPAARRALSGPGPMRAIATLMRAALGPEPTDGSAAGDGDDAWAAVLRNALLSALILVEGAAYSPDVQPGIGVSAAAAAAVRERAEVAAAAAEALVASGALGSLSQAAACEGRGCGEGSAALAAGVLAAMAAGGVGREEALDALLAPSALHGVVFLLAELKALQQQQQQQGEEQQPPPLASAPGALHALRLLGSVLPPAMAARPTKLLRGLLEERLVGNFLRAAPLRASQLLAARLVSGVGRAVLSEVERDWAVDVPLALAQAIVLPVHLTLPAAARPRHQQEQQQHQQEQQQQQEQQHQQQGVARASDLLDSSGPEEVHTDVLAARLLLQGQRLEELMSALAAECAAAEAAAAEGAGGEDAPAEATAAVLELGSYLMARGAELSRVELTRGASVTDSATASNCSGGDGGWAAAAPAAGGAGPVVFVFGAHEHCMTHAAYRRVRRASKLMHSALVQGGGGAPLDAIRGLCVPRLPEEASCWAFGLLEQWVEESEAGHADVTDRGALAAVQGGGSFLNGLEAEQAATLWVAADFWQVDGLQAACEDRMASLLACAGAPAGNGEAASGALCNGCGGGAFAKLLQLVLALCSQHAPSSGRLQRLAAQAFLLGAGAPGGGGPLCGAEAARLVARHSAALLPAVFGEVRDRLVALCVLNLPRPDSDSPEADVH